MHRGDSGGEFSSKSAEIKKKEIFLKYFGDTETDQAADTVWKGGGTYQFYQFAAPHGKNSKNW